MWNRHPRRERPDSLPIHAPNWPSQSYAQQVPSNNVSGGAFPSNTPNTPYIVQTRPPAHRNQYEPGAASNRQDRRAAQNAHHHNSGGIGHPRGHRDEAHHGESPRPPHSTIIQQDNASAFFCNGHSNAHPYKHAASNGGDRNYRGRSAHSDGAHAQNAHHSRALDCDTAIGRRETSGHCDSSERYKPYGWRGVDWRQESRAQPCLGGREKPLNDYGGDRRNSHAPNSKACDEKHSSQEGKTNMEGARRERKENGVYRDIAYPSLLLNDVPSVYNNEYIFEHFREFHPDRVNNVEGKLGQRLILFTRNADMQNAHEKGDFYFGKNNILIHAERLETKLGCTEDAKSSYAERGERARCPSRVRHIQHEQEQSGRLRNHNIEACEVPRSCTSAPRRSPCLRKETECKGQPISPLTQHDTRKSHLCEANGSNSMELLSKPTYVSATAGVMTNGVSLGVEETTVPEGEKLGNVIEEKEKISLKTESLEKAPEACSEEENMEILIDMCYKAAREKLANTERRKSRSSIVRAVLKFVKERKNAEEEKLQREEEKRLSLEQNRIAKARGAIRSDITAQPHLDSYLKGDTSSNREELRRRDSSPLLIKKRPRRSRFSDLKTPEAQETPPGVKRGNNNYPFGDRVDKECQRIPKKRCINARGSHSTDIADEKKFSPPNSREGHNVVASEEPVERGGSSDKVFEKPKFVMSASKESQYSSIMKEELKDMVSQESKRPAKESSLKLSLPEAGDGTIPHLILRVPELPKIEKSRPGSVAVAEVEKSGVTKSVEVVIPIRKKRNGQKSKKAKKGKKSAGIASSKKNGIAKTIPNKEMNTSLRRWMEEKFPDALDIKKQDNDTRSKDLEEIVTPSCGTKKKEEVEKGDEEMGDDDREGKCARSEIYVRSLHRKRYGPRNVSARSAMARAALQSSRESRQRNRVYQKGVELIKPKNDLITKNCLQQRKKAVFFDRSQIHGMGLYAKEEIDVGEFIIEYVGEIIRKSVADMREKEYTRQGMGDSYMFRLSGDQVIDATRRGGIARFINHSCEPNVIAKIISVGSQDKIVFYSKRAIKVDEELTYDYKFDFEADDKKIPCLCGAASCRKYLN